MSDTPRTDTEAQHYRDMQRQCGDNHPCVYADFARELERENAKLRETIENVRALGIVHRVPDGWDYAGMGGGPTIEQCDEHDLSTIPV